MPPVQTLPWRCGRLLDLATKARSGCSWTCRVGVLISKDGTLLWCCTAQHLTTPVQTQAPVRNCINQERAGASWGILCRCKLYVGHCPVPCPISQALQGPMFSRPVPGHSLAGTRSHHLLLPWKTKDDKSCPARPK